MTIKSVAIHARIAEETRDLARVCAKKKGMTDSAFYRLAIEEAVRKYRPRHKVGGPEFVAESAPWQETTDIRVAFAQEIARMEPPFTGTERDL